MGPSRNPRLGYANVTATLALALALSTGGAYAHGKVTAGDIAKNAVTSKHIAKGQVKTSDLKKNAVKGKNVKDGSLQGDDVAAGSLTGDHLAPRTEGLALAGVSFATDATINQEFNRLGADVTVVRDALGDYDVTIPGASFSGFQNMLAAVTGGSGEYCYINHGVGSTINVRCRDILSNDLMDSAVKFVLFNDAPGGSPRQAPGGGSDD